MTSSPSVSEPKEGNLARAEIDASCRLPVLVLFAAGIFWLLAGLFLDLIASIKLFSPEFLTWDLGFLSYGRIQAAQLHAATYGWGCSVGLGAALWLAARLCGTPLRHSGGLALMSLLWTAGVAMGVFSILAGWGTAIEWMEFPKNTIILLFASFVGLGTGFVDLFVRRQPGILHAAQWYLLAAMCCFPWLYATASVLLVFLPAPGSVQPILQAWFAQGFFWLWFTPLALACIFYLIPKVTGGSICCYQLALPGFWFLILFSPWTAGSRLIDGPAPAWIISAGVASGMILLIPILTHAINHHGAILGHLRFLSFSPVLRFTAFAAAAFTLAGLQSCLMAMPGWSRLFHFTLFETGQWYLAFYGFFSMSLTGAVYFIVPRLVEWEWPSVRLIRIHFWCATLGILLISSCLSLAGLIQGNGLTDRQISFSVVTDLVKPLLVAKCLFLILFLIGQAAFGLSFISMLTRRGERKTEPTLLANSREASGA